MNAKATTQSFDLSSPAPVTKPATATQLLAEMKRVEADFNTELVGGSVKGGMKALGAGSKDLWQVDPKKLRVIEDFNPRVHNAEYVQHIRNIADSIKANGFYQDQALAGFSAKENGENIVYIYSGHTRLAATLLAISEGVQVPVVPVAVSQEGLTREDMTVALISGNGGKSLTFYESAIVCKRLIQFGFTVEQISRRTLIQVPGVEKRLTLMGAPLKLRQMVANDEVSATTALEQLAKHGDQVVVKMEEAQARATEAGKTKVTAKTANAVTPQMKYVKKSAPRLFEAASAVRQDPAFDKLSDETKAMLEELLGEIAKKGQVKGGDKADDASGEGGEA